MQQDSLAYLASQYRIIHEDPKRYRGNLQPYFINQITDLVQRRKARTLLDYGSGKGNQYHEHQQHNAWGGILPHCYDPGVPAYSIKSTASFDGVICTDVMEHIPTTHVDWVLRDVCAYANKFAFFCIFTDSAKAKLPDGRNAHLTIKEPWWWNALFLTVLKDLYPDRHINCVDTDLYTTFICNGLEVQVVYRSKAHKDWL